MVERKIGEIFKCKAGDTVVCERISPRLKCKGCIYADKSELVCRADELIGACHPLMRSDGNSVIFRKIGINGTIADDIVVLERIAEEYPGKTIDNIIAQLKSRLSELAKIDSERPKRRRHKTT